MKKIFLTLSGLTFLFSGLVKPELLSNNDPSKYTVIKDILWASPGGFDLTMDIYTPQSGKDFYPVVVIFHGGGWLIRNKSIMDQMSKYLVTNSEYVVCNVNYRLLADKGNTINLNQIIEDVFGSILWIKENIINYKGDNTKLAVTGDSAGGHLSAMIVNMGTKLSSKGFTTASQGFNPTYLPEGKKAEEVAKENGLQVQAAILSYGSYDIYTASLKGFEKMKNFFWLISGSLPRGIFGNNFNAVDNPEMYKAVSPSFNLPMSSERKLPPQLLTVGSNDKLVTPHSVKTYKEKLESSGHHAEYWEYQGQGHAFLDSNSNGFLGNNFEVNAPPALDVMISFLNKTFYEYN